MYVYIHIYTVCINVENLKIYILNTYTFQSCNVFENGYIYIYMLFAGWEVRMVKNCDRGLENAVTVARGQR